MQFLVFSFAHNTVKVTSRVCSDCHNPVMFDPQYSYIRRPDGQIGTHFGVDIWEEKGTVLIVTYLFPDDSRQRLKLMIQPSDLPSGYAFFPGKTAT